MIFSGLLLLSCAMIRKEILRRGTDEIALLRWGERHIFY
jgi:hypothetical protein